MMGAEEQVCFQLASRNCSIGTPFLCKIYSNDFEFVVDYEFAGQNIGFTGDTWSYPAPAGVIDEITNAWFDEYKIATPVDIQKVTNGDG